MNDQQRASAANMTFMEQVFAVFAVLTILGASVTYWRTHRRR